MPPKIEKQQLVSLSRHAPAHRSVLVNDFLAKNIVTALEHPPYSPGLASADFHLFPVLKSTSKRRRFCDATDIIKNAMEELKRLSKNWFQKCFQRLYTLWQKYIAVQGQYFEGNVA
jgi:histone-lysine N-methyltransferase SETMAR